MASPTMSAITKMGLMRKSPKSPTVTPRTITKSSRRKKTPKRRKNSESPIQDQLIARRDLLLRVDALVKRAQGTARDLAASKGHVTQLASDIRSGVRLLLKYPILSVVAVLTLGLGLGLGTTVFCVVDGALFKGLPFPDADRLAEFG